MFLNYVEVEWRGPRFLEFFFEKNQWRDFTHALSLSSAKYLFLTVDWFGCASGTSLVFSSGLQFVVFRFCNTEHKLEK